MERQVFWGLHMAASLNTEGLALEHKDWHGSSEGVAMLAHYSLDDALVL